MGLPFKQTKHTDKYKEQSKTPKKSRTKGKNKSAKQSNKPKTPRKLKDWTHYGSFLTQKERNLPDGTKEHNIFVIGNFDLKLYSEILRDVEELFKTNEYVRLNLCIDSPGGQANYLKKLIGYLCRRKNLEFNTTCLSEASSCAQILFTLGKKRRAVVGSKVLVHEARIQQYPGSSLFSSTLSLDFEKREDLNELNMEIVNLLAKVTKHDQKFWNDKIKMGKDFKMEASKAVELGLATEIVEEIGV